MNSLLAHCAVVLGCLTLVAAPSQAELLTNPGFEDTDMDSNQGDGWGSFGSAGFNAFFGANGHASLFMDNPGNFGGVFQTGIAVMPGLEYTFELTDVRIESNAAANARFGLEYYDAGDATKLGETISSISLSPTGDNLTFSMTGTPVAGAAFVRPIILFDNVTSTANGQENLFVFGASLTAVPEPSSLLLAAVVGIGFAARRQRQAV